MYEISLSKNFEYPCASFIFIQINSFIILTKSDFDI